MNILVVDVAADSGGALTVLHEHYNRFKYYTGNHYYFCVSIINLENTSNITILPFPWTKKSWLHRLWFDVVYSRFLIRKYSIQKILSLQNIMINAPKCIPQDIYLHQSLPFSDKRFSIKESRKLWVYQNIISKFIYRSVKNADSITVQTQWLRNAIISKCKVSQDKILVEAPKIDIHGIVTLKKGIKRKELWFFYPAAHYIHKNHCILFQAVDLLDKNNFPSFKLILTISEQELLKEELVLFKRNSKYIELIGPISHERVMELYAESVLIFPSFVESFGLPLLEARMTGNPILSIDSAFAHEILDGYSCVQYFDPDDDKKLSQLMFRFIQHHDQFI